MKVHSFLHISDLHIGRSTELERCVADTLPTKTPFRKYAAGHQHNALVRLRDLYSKMKKADGDNVSPSLIVTGDLTSCGRPTQYQYGHELLSAGSHFGDANGRAPIGLRVKKWSRTAVTGNHDHFFDGGNHAPNYFESFPYTNRINLPNGTAPPIKVRFIGLDTDADISSPSIQQTFARGSFRSQLDQLDNQIPYYDRNEREIRVLLLHHSYGDRHRHWLPYILKIQTSSKKRLREFLADHKIPVVLSGHIHVPDICKHTSDRGWTFMEARCGTTAQSGQESIQDGASVDEIRGQLRKTFSCMVHDLDTREESQSNEEEVWWSTRTYAMSSTSGFRPVEESEWETYWNAIKVWPL